MGPHRILVDGSDVRVSGSGHGSYELPLKDLEKPLYAGRAEST
jgi:hypothetical protein